MLSFLIKLKMKGVEVRLDYWSLLKELKETVPINDNIIDLKKQTEQRFFSLIASAQNSLCNADDEEEFVLDLVIKNIKIKRARADIISARPSKFGKKGEFTYRFHVQIILDNRVTCPNNYVLCNLRRQSFEYDRGKKYFFKLS